MSFGATLGGIFSQLGKNQAFKTAIAAIGTAGTAALVSKIAPGTAGAAQYKEQPVKAAAPAPVPLAQAVPWQPILLLAAVGILAFVLVKLARGKRT